MDSDLEHILSLAKKRGSKHVKKEVSPEELPELMAELGVLLLVEYDRIKDLRADERTLSDLNDIQQRIDHFRRAIFALKRKIF